MGEEFKVVAVVKFNDGEALVLNRPIEFVYEEVGRDFVGSDGPFRDFLGYGRDGSMKAFGGRELSLTMKDGSIRKIKDNWWATWKKGYKDVVLKDIDGLQRCYVFNSAHITPEDYATLRGEYTGPVYPYWDYEKIIKHEYWVNLYCKENQKVRELEDKERKRIKRGELIANLMVGRSILLRAVGHLNSYESYKDLPCERDDMEVDHIGGWKRCGKEYGFQDADEEYENMVECPRCSAQYAAYQARKILKNRVGRINGILTRLGNNMREKEK